MSKKVKVEIVGLALAINRSANVYEALALIEDAMTEYAERGLIDATVLDYWRESNLGDVTEEYKDVLEDYNLEVK